MTNYERLIDEACKDGVDIVSRDFKSDRIKGLYCNGVICLSRKLTTSAEKACTLAEELGHHHTSVGNIIDLNSHQNAKQERQARLWGYNKKIGLQGLIRAYEHGCQNRYEIADYLEVTEEYLQECINIYRDKYGTGITVDNYYIMFIPYLAVGQLLK